MFWSKCSKLLVNASGQLINCNNCPCGYWAVFGFKWRWLDCDTMQPDPCSWNFRIQAKEVKDNKVYWDYGCIQINQNMGLCGTKKGKFNCWSDCYNWDDEGNCIQQMQYCDCIQVEVYNISGCFDNYSAFQAAFVGGCGVAPEYPAIFQTSYGNVFMTSAAYDCIQNYWEKIYIDKYTLNYTLEIQSMNQSWWEGVNQYVYEMEYDDYCGDENCYYIDEYNGSCPDGQQHCVSAMQGQHIGFNAKAWLENDVSVTTSGGYAAVPQTGGWCCAEVSTVAALPEINAFITEKVNDKDSYYLGTIDTFTCKNSYDLCKNFTYESKCWDNYYGDVCGCRITFNWAKLKLVRSDLTPAYAAGVKFLCKITHTRENIGYGKDEKIVENLEQEISINFDDVCQDLPLATETNLLTILQTPNCNGDCDYGDDQSWWRNEPHYNWYGFNVDEYYENDVWVDRYEIEIIGKEYIK